MTDFETAARKAAEEIWEKDPSFVKMQQIIAKHYADLAETFGLLCELAKCAEDFRAIRYQRNAYTDNRGGYLAWSEDCEALSLRLKSLLTNPRIAALLAEKKG